MSKEYKLTVEFRNGQRYCYYGKTKKQAIAEFKRNFGSFRGFVKKEMGISINQLNITIMERYDYLEAVKEDVLNYINENNIVVTSKNRDEVEQDLNDTLFTCDSVTGNASGSYTFNAWTAEEYLCHNLGLLGEALTEFGCDMSYLERGAEACDVTIRCYLLGQAISEVLDEVETEEE